MSTKAGKRPTVSAVLISKNAQAHLRECLASVRWCDEIVVLDSGSTDATRAICEEFGATFSVTADWPGFGFQKNRAIALATGDWIFSLDTDEICTPELRAAIEHAVHDPRHVAFEMPRRSRFVDHFMQHGGWWPDHVARLFRRGRARLSDSRVHERLIVDGSVGRLAPPLVHYTYDTLDQALEKMTRYARAGAEQAYAAGKRSSLPGAVGHAAWAFLRSYVLRLGILDGGPGFVLALYNAHTTYYRYLNLWYLGRRKA